MQNHSYLTLQKGIHHFQAFKVPDKTHFSYFSGVGRAGAGSCSLLQPSYERSWLNPSVLTEYSSSYMALKKKKSPDCRNFQCWNQLSELSEPALQWTFPQKSMKLTLFMLDTSWGCIMDANWQVQICMGSLEGDIIKVYVNRAEKISDYRFQKE